MSTIRSRVRVNVHSGAKDYVDRQGDIVPTLDRVGFGGVRDNNPKGAAILKGAGFKGVCQFVVAVDGTLNATDAATAATRQVQTALASGFDVIEMQNEFNVNGGAALTKIINAAAVAAVGGRLPIVQSALGQSAQGPAADLAQAQALGPTPGAVKGAAHSYRANRPDGPVSQTGTWQWWRAQNMACLPYTARFLPWQVTETGAWWPNDGTPIDQVAGQSHKPTPPDVWGQQIIPDLVDWLRLGAEAVFFYQLFFTPSSGVKTLGPKNREQYFGIENTPAEVALTAFLAAFGDYDDLAAVDLVPKLALAAAADARVQQMQSELTAANTALVEAQTKITAAQSALG